MFHGFARILTVGLAILITFGAFYVAFAQSFSTGTYLDPSCSASSTNSFTAQYVYVLFELPGPGEGVGYLATGTSTISTVSLDTISSTCLPFYYPPGTYTASLLSSTGTVTATSTVLFTEFSPFTVAAYPGASCTGSQASTFPSGENIYVIIAGPGDFGNAWYGYVKSGTATLVAFGPYTEPSSTSTCYTLTSLSAGTYTGLIASVAGSTTSASTLTPLSTNFTISAAVPDLAYGFIPLMAILLVVYILLGRRVHPSDKH